MEKIVQVTVGLPVEGPFDYSVSGELSEQIAVGKRVWVSFHNRPRLAVVTAVLKKSAFQNLNPVLDVLDRDPVLDGDMLRLTEEFAELYGCSRGEAVETVLPAALRGKRKLTESFPPRPSSPAPGEKLLLVHDQGGEDRWKVLEDHIRRALSAGKGVIFLVPEVILMDKVVEQLTARLKVPVCVFDRKMTPKDELEKWLRVRRGEARLVVGTRSEIFAPLPDPGLIIVGDEENSAYKQEQTPRYHVRDVALMRSRIAGVPVIFVSSAPSAELWWMFKKKKENLIEAFSGRGLAALNLIDLTNYKFGRGAHISAPLQNKIEAVLKDGKKAVIYFNRREDNAPASPEKTVHKRGIAKVAEEIRKKFPQASVVTYHAGTAAVPAGADIIVGTRAVFRILHRFRPALIGVLGVDNDLSLPDFRASQRVFSTLIHLRQSAEKEVVVQTGNKDSYSLTCARDLDFTRFYKEETGLRKQLGLPPFSHLVKILLRGSEEADVQKQAAGLFQILSEGQPAGLDVTDPHPDTPPRLRRQYRLTILVRGRNVKPMVAYIRRSLKKLKRKKKIHITLNLDP